MECIRFGHLSMQPHLGDQPALLVTLDLGQVGVSASVNHHLIEDLILLPLHGLAVTVHFTEEAHTQGDVHSPHLQSSKANSHILPLIIGDAHAHIAMLYKGIMRLLLRRESFSNCADHTSAIKMISTDC